MPDNKINSPELVNAPISGVITNSGEFVSQASRGLFILMFIPKLLKQSTFVAFKT